MLWRIGTMGFSYPDWVGPFYPLRTRPADFLSTYARVFDSLEIDTTFYGTPPPERVARWAAQVPSTFRFCPKAPRSITHDHALSPGREFDAFLAAMRRFGGNLGPIFIHLPPSFTSREFPRLHAFLRHLPEDLRFAVQLRHMSWETPETFDLLARHRCAWVAADYSTDPFPIHATTDFLYIRFVGIHQQFANYDHERSDMTARLAWWQSHAEEQPATTAFAFFNNDYAGHAPATANRMKVLADQPVVLPAAAAPAQDLLF